MYLGAQYNLFADAKATLAMTLPAFGVVALSDFIKAALAVVVLVGVKAAYPKALNN
jgi:hypothetical protein